MNPASDSDSSSASSSPSPPSPYSFGESASNLINSAKNMALLFGPYMAQIKTLYNVITSTDPNMTQEAKATAIINMITSQVGSQAREIAGQTCDTTQNPFIKFICNLNTYKKRICSVVVEVNQARVVFDFITKDPAFISQLKTKLINVDPNEIQNIINNPMELATLATPNTPNTPNTNDCEKQIDNMLEQLIPGFSRFSGGKKYRRNKQTKSKRRMRSKRRKSIRKSQRRKR